MLHCICCDATLRTEEEISQGYCDACQTSIRQVWDKDAYELGQISPKVIYTDLDWTNFTED